MKPPIHDWNAMPDIENGRWRRFKPACSGAHIISAKRQIRPAKPIISSVLSPLAARDSEKRRLVVLLVLDFEKNGHYSGGTMTVPQAVAFVERIRERTGKYPGLYCSEYRLRQMLYGSAVTAAQRRALVNCWLWI